MLILLNAGCGVEDPDAPNKETMDKLVAIHATRQEVEASVKFLCKIGHLVCLLTTFMTACCSSNDSRGKVLYHDLTELFAKYYPAYVSHFSDNKMHFEYNVGVLLTYTVVGYENPVIVRGPQKGGVEADLELMPGKYNGQAVLPQTFEHVNYMSFGLAPYSSTCDCYWSVSLKYPKDDISQDFLKQFRERVQKFEKIQ